MNLSGGSPAIAQAFQAAEAARPDQAYSFSTFALALGIHLSDPNIMRWFCREMERNDEPRPANPRKYGRVRQKSLVCQWGQFQGQVLDISRGGMRVKCGRKHPQLGERLELTLTGYDLPGPLIGLVTWIQRVGVMSHEMGLKFDEVSPEVLQQISIIAGYGVCPHMNPDDLAGDNTNAQAA